MTVRWTPAAIEDLRGIDAWLREEASNAIAARILSTIRARADFLLHFPHGGRPSREGMRVLRVLSTPYLLQYRIVDGGVQVLRVHHEREDWHVHP